MNKRTLIAVTAIISVFVGLVFLRDSNPTPPDYGQYKLTPIKNLAKTLSAAQDLNPDTIFAASDDTGNLPEKVIGDPAKAEVILYEYADYTCSHCAEWSATLDQLVEDSHEELAVVYRGYLLGSSNNSVAAASAATAAQIQGCWQEYKNLLFANQSSWTYLSGDELKNEFISCFEAASSGKGDTEKFLADMESETVAKKVAFEYELGNIIQLKGTPTFRLDGENIAIPDLKATIKNKLSKT